MTNLFSDTESRIMDILPCYWDFCKGGNISMAEKIKDSKGRILRENETQRDNGLYIYSYTDLYGTR